jgi:hypothetical protein
MYLKCLDEYRAKVKGLPVTFEETRSFGYVYETDDKVGKKLLATGKFAPCSAEESKKLEVITIITPGPTPVAAPAVAELTTEPEVEPELSPESESEAESAPESEEMNSELEPAAEPEAEPRARASRARSRREE